MVTDNSTPPLHTILVVMVHGVETIGYNVMTLRVNLPVVTVVGVRPTVIVVYTITECCRLNVGWGLATHLLSLATVGIHV